VKRVCTLVLSRTLWADEEGHSLSAMMYRLEPARAAELTRGAHGARDDVNMNFLLLGHIVKRLKCTSMETLYAESEAARIPKTMPFGKHKGLPIAAVPHDYRMWYRRQKDPPPDPYLLKAWGLV
jgi:exodeoxyribonuclease X